MNKTERVVSKDGIRYIDVMQAEDGSFILHKFARRYDPDEDKDYVIRELPNPQGRYGDLKAAINEAETVLKLN